MKQQPVPKLRRNARLACIIQGLSLVSLVMLVHAQDHHFHFTARVGRGSGHPSRMGAPVMDQLAGVRVLIVDDNTVNRRILNQTCTTWGMQPEPADSGIVGLTLLRRAQAAGTPCRLVLLDAQMPEMDGFEMARRIHEDTDLSGLVVMMLSSCDLSNDAQRCRELGISRYLVKPVMQADLLDAILVTLGLAKGQPVEPDSAASSGGEVPEVLAGRRVLVAEDHPVNRKLVTKMLEKRSLIPVLVSNGSEVLRALESDTFDLILMDVQMPGMDGLQTTATIRENEKATRRHIPILAMTAHAMNRDREKCLAAGMDAYLSKPVRPSELYEAIEELLTNPVPGA